MTSGCLQVDLELQDKIAEAAGIMERLEQACDELMTEFISKKRAANWGIINSAMYDSARYRLVYQKAIEDSDRAVRKVGLKSEAWPVSPKTAQKARVI